MKKRIVCIILMLSVIFGASAFNSTQAWFSVGENKHQYLDSGKLDFRISGDFKDFGDEAILPGMELIDEPVTVKNYSSIESQLRFAIYYLKEPNSPFTRYNPMDSTEIIQPVIDEKWNYSSSDGWFYYEGSTYILPPVETETTTGEAQQDEGESNVIDIISSLKYIGAKTGIEFSGKNIQLRITIQSKQAYYVNWSTINSIILSKYED